MLKSLWNLKSTLLVAGLLLQGAFPPPASRGSVVIGNFVRVLSISKSVLIIHVTRNIVAVGFIQLHFQTPGPSVIVVVIKVCTKCATGDLSGVQQAINILVKSRQVQTVNIRNGILDSQLV